MEVSPQSAPPQTQQPPPSKQEPAKKKREMPETVRAVVLVWAVAIGGELIHQLISIISSIVDPTALRQAASDTANQSAQDGAAIPDSVVNMSVYLSIFMMALVTLAIVGLLAWMLILFARRHKWAGYARRLLYLFSFFFAFRLLLVFLTTSVASDVPVWLVAIDGVVQIAVAVAAICGIILAGRDEVLKWTGEDEDLKKLLKAREEKDKYKNDKSGKSN
ncbi:hypothetical protein ACXZ66_02360 [Corynebacterium sp. S7]